MTKRNLIGKSAYYVPRASQPGEHQNQRGNAQVVTTVLKYQQRKQQNCRPNRPSEQP